jgi:hypothetical protein
MSAIRKVRRPTDPRTTRSRRLGPSESGADPSGPLDPNAWDSDLTDRR